MDLKFVNKDNAYIINQNKNSIRLYLFMSGKTISISDTVLTNDETLIESNIAGTNGIITIIEYKNHYYYLHLNNESLFLTKYLNGHSRKSINLNINPLFNGYKLMKTKYSYGLVDQLNNIYELDYNIFVPGSNKINSLQRKSDDEPYIYLKIQYNNCISFIEYNNKATAHLQRTQYINVLYNNIDIGFTSLSNNEFKLKSLSNDKVKRSQIHKKNVLILDAKNEISRFEPILLIVNNLNYIIEYYKKDKIKLSYDKKVNLLLESTEVKSRPTSKGIIYKGEIIHKYRNVKVDNVLDRNGMKLAKIQWIDSTKFKFLIPSKKLSKLSDIHNNLYIAYGSKVIYPLHKKQNSNKKTILCYKNVNNQTFISRVNLNDNYTITSVPRSPIYSKLHQIKIEIAYITSKLMNKIIKTNINLYFEKDASAADESGFITFEEVKKNREIRTINKFILDNKNNKYENLVKNYGKDIIKRFTFRHYLYIFLANNFISSELSNHVLSVRVYNDLLSKKIQQTSLYFLQHGIMFAKPVENPMALGFHKENQSNNLIKSVISSDLEAKEFYKMGYSDQDLMKTGLPKLDKASLNKDANKIAYMPTWRYWEEGNLLTGDIENTSYYKSLIEVIKLFEEAGLLDRLLLVPHNKFAEYLKGKFGKYEKNISTNPTEALKSSIIFITDFSSIIYDATYRGAYPIFYWKDKNYLITKYKAEPPVNEVNAPGKIAKTDKELIQFVLEAIENDYRIPIYIQERYLKINEFNDNKNTERVIKELRSLNVL